MANRSWTKMAALAIGVAFGSGACARRYHVRPDHLARAEEQQRAGDTEVALPALTRDREPTFLRYASIKRLEGTEPGTGLQEVVARDPRTGLRIPGWIVTGISLLPVALGVSAFASGHEENGIPLVIAGGLMLSTGVTLLLFGYTLDGSEAPAASPGMPASLEGP